MSNENVEGKRRLIAVAAIVMQLCLGTGRIVLSGPGKELLGDPRVREAYLGVDA